MANRAKLFQAHFEQVLLYADGPQIVLLSSVSDTKVVGVAIKEFDSYQYPFFAAQVSRKQFHDYLTEKFDLRYLLLKPDSKKNFVFDLAGAKDGVKTIQLSKIKLSNDNLEKFLPDHGLFAREHTEEVNVSIAAPSSEQTFGVDGSWELEEFSHFYRNVSDLYAIVNNIDSFLDEQVSIDKKQKIQDAFVKPFEGGGSYLAMYGSLAKVQSQENRLRVKGIQYFSPGKLVLRGSDKSFADIKYLIGNFDENSEAIKKAYMSLRSILAERKMLRMNSEKFKANNPSIPIISEQSKSLANALDIAPYDNILAIAGGHVLIAAKVLLSIYRRAESLQEFFLEGRANLDAPQ